MTSLIDCWSSSVTKPLMRALLMLYGRPLLDGLVDWMLIIYMNEPVDVTLIRCLDEPIILVLGTKCN